MSDTDLSRIVGLIMENPKLIEEIKALGAKDSAEQENGSTEKESTALSSDINPTAQASTVQAENPGRARRRELLSALKPYVSENRAKAIDSMMSIADIIDMMRST